MSWKRGVVLREGTLSRGTGRGPGHRIWNAKTAMSNHKTHGKDDINGNNCQERVVSMHGGLLTWLKAGLYFLHVFFTLFVTPFMHIMCLPERALSLSGGIFPGTIPHSNNESGAFANAQTDPRLHLWLPPISYRFPVPLDLFVTIFVEHHPPRQLPQQVVEIQASSIS